MTSAPWPGPARHPLVASVPEFSLKKEKVGLSTTTEENEPIPLGLT